MRSTEAISNFEHPEDILGAALRFAADKRGFALSIITDTESGGVRAPGAMMAVSADGDHSGYLSGGCIDADVCAQAMAAIKTNEVKTLRYGTGSPFVDIKLPCGGAIDLLVIPSPCVGEIEKAATSLKSRKPVSLFLDPDHGISTTARTNSAAVFNYQPKMKLRIAGRGHEVEALQRIAQASGFETEIWSIESSRDEITSKHLTVPNDLPANTDDQNTAVVLMFHAEDWEAPLLEHALAGNAFYVGAVGSRSTHQKRCETLRSHGVTASQIDRIHAPIGIIPSMRDASTLAISTLAEIVKAYSESERAS